MCPRCTTFDVDSFDSNADFCARLPVAPIFSDYVTNVIVNEEISRKRKHKAFVTSQASAALDTRDSMVSDDGTITDDEALDKYQRRATASEHGRPDSKQLKKDSQKGKKLSSGAQSFLEKGAKKSEKISKKRPDSLSAPKKSKPVAKKPKIEKAPGKSLQSSGSAAEAGSSQPSSSTFRPQYENVFSR